MTVFQTDLSEKICISCFYSSDSKPKYLLDIYQDALNLPKAWNNYVGNTALSTQRLKAIENACLPNTKFLYAVVQDGEQILAGFYFQLQTINSESFGLDSSEIPIPNIIVNWIRRKTFKLLVMGNMYHRSASGWFVNGFPDTEKAYIIKRIIRLLRLETNPDFVLLKDTELDGLLEIPSKTWLQIPSDVQMQLNLRSNWLTLADYTADLSRKYAARVRKTRQAFDSCTVKQLDVIDIANHLPELELLYQNVAGNASVKLSQINAAYLLKLKETLGNNFIVEGYYMGAEIVGFAATTVKSTDIDICYVGYNPEANHKHQLYHNMLLNGLELAIRLQKKHLFLGRTALEAKAILGAEPVLGRNFLLVKNHLLRPFFQMSLNTVAQQQGTSWMERNPFRENTCIGAAIQDVN